MKQIMPWNVTGIPPEAREIAREAAARDGVTVGDWLTRCIYLESQQGTRESVSRPGPQHEREQHDAAPQAGRDEILFQLGRMEGANESALRRIDETLQTLAQRGDAPTGPQGHVRNSEHPAVRKTDAALRKQEQIIRHLAQRVENIERTADPAPLRKAARGLHQGLSRLAEQVAKNEISTTNRIEALAGNVDAVSRTTQETRAKSAHLAKDFEERLSVLTEQIARSEEIVSGMDDRARNMLESHSAAFERKIADVSARLAGTERIQKEQARSSEDAFESIKERLNTAERANRDVHSKLRRSLEDIGGRLDSFEYRHELERAPEATAIDSDLSASLPGMGQELVPRSQDPTVTNAVQKFLAKARRSENPAGEARPAGGGLTLASARPVRKEDQPEKKGTVLRRAFPVLSVGFLLATGVGYLIVSGGVWAFGKSVGRPHAAFPPAAAHTAEANGSALPAITEQYPPPGVGNRAPAVARPDSNANTVDPFVASTGEFETIAAADLAQATARYAQGALQGHRSSMHNLAVAYANGVGVEKNLTEASRWFRAAADLGLADSQFNLALLYERGMGVPISPSEAYKWYFIAAVQGDNEAKRRAELLGSRMAEEERVAIERAAANDVTQPIKRAANEFPTLAQLQ